MVLATVPFRFVWSQTESSCSAGEVCVTVGLAGPYTGAYAGVGPDLLMGADRAMKILAQDGVRLNIITLDTRGTPDGALTAIEEGITTEHVDIVVGAIGDPVMGALTDRNSDTLFVDIGEYRTAKTAESSENSMTFSANNIVGDVMAAQRALNINSSHGYQSFITLEAIGTLYSQNRTASATELVGLLTAESVDTSTGSASVSDGRLEFVVKD